MSKNNLQNKIVMFILYFMFGPFLLLSRFSYGNITISKFFMVMAVMLLLTITFIVSLKSYYKEYNELLEKNKVIYGFIFAFVACLLVSALFCADKKVGFIGNTGRYTGSIPMILICCGIAVVGLKYSYKRMVLDVFIVFSDITAFWGILNFFGVDLFGMHAEVVEYMREQYLAGIGQKTFYAALILMATSIAIILYIYEDNVKKMSFYLISVVIFFFAGYVSMVDSFILTLFFVFLLLPAFAVKDIRKIERLVNIAIAFLFIAIALDYIVPFTDTMEERFDYATQILVRTSFSRIALVLVVVFRILLFAVKKFMCNLKMNIPAVIFPILTSLVFLGIVAVIIYYTYILYAPDYYNSRYYLYFDDNWGSGRGYVWKRCWQAFWSSDLYHKLFGFGADMTGNVLMDVYGYASLERGFFDNAHNEYLQYLLSYGILGLVSYLGMTVTICKKLIKNVKQDENGLKADGSAIFMALFAYMFQAVFGVNNIIVTPIFFLLLGVALSLCKSGGINGRKK